MADEADDFVCFVLVELVKSVARTTLRESVLVDSNDFSSASVVDFRFSLSSSSSS